MVPVMPNVRRRTLLGAAAAATLAACDSGPDYPPGPLRIASGGVGGVYYTYAEGMAAVYRDALPGLRPTVLTTPASVENLRLVAAGTAEIGFTTADAASDAYTGAAPFSAPLPVQALGRIYENYLHLVVRVDRGINDVAELRGRRVSVGAPASGTELFATRLLPLAGLNIARDVRAERLAPDIAADAVATGRLDAMFFSGGIPTGAIASLTRHTAIALVELGSYVPRLRSLYGEVYVERTIPVSAYGLAVPTPTVGVANYLVVSRAMDAQVGYAVVRALFEHRDQLAAMHPAGSRLDRGSAVNTLPLPLHPGAVRYYREAKV
ncbi:MAG: TAXI family TRAP transporter solute-binding subunit [Actinobacteria bacterium]|nr:MAG: TAXI family TRAP transporter solute-binding subunit [Actinomycetota bacterium]